MPRLSDDRFKIFVSHKHENHTLAVAFQQALEGLSPTIECFVSGANLSAGSDWNREIRHRLAESHMLVLLFTRPTASWDWCLFETGLFTRSDLDDISAVVCICEPSASTPSPLANLQAVPAQVEAVERFLGELCRATWRVSDDWRVGAIAPRVRQPQLNKAATKIVEAFPDSTVTEGAYHPCHRVVLDVRGVDGVESGIPEGARVVEGLGGTTEFTLSLFNQAIGRRTHTWGDLLDAVDGRESAWRAQLDRRYVLALKEELFTPITATLRAWNQGRRRQRSLKPVLYRILREPAVDRRQQAGAAGAEPRGRPAEITVLFDPQATTARIGGPELTLVRINARFQVEVIEEFAGSVRARAREGLPVLEDIREALALVYDEANTYGVFNQAELRRVYGADYEARGVDAMGAQWEATLRELDVAIADQDVDAVEAQLAVLAELNRSFSILSTERYLQSLKGSH